MACFDNYIGIEHCDSDAPSSGKYLKDGGISTHELNMIAGQDYVDGVEFGNAKINHAISIIQNDIYSHFANKYKAKSLIDFGRAGHVADNMIEQSGSNQLRGVQLKLTQKSDFIKVYIKDVEIFCNYTGDISLYVYDVKQNKLLDTFTLTSVTDEVSTVSIDKHYYSNQKDLNIAFLYNANGIKSYKTTIGSVGCARCEINNFTACDN